MITEDYVNFEIAKLLKEKGFELPSLVSEEWVCSMYDEKREVKWGCYSDNWYCRITLQMAMKWLREVHNLIITIDYDLYEMPFDKHKVGYGYSIQQTTNPAKLFKIGENIYDCYEEACEAAIKYVLENLI